MRYFLPIAIVLTLAGCATPRPAPVVRPVAAVTPPPRPIAPPPSLASDWNDWPFTPGDWRYYHDPQGYRSASFGLGDDLVFAVTCDLQRRKVSLVVVGSQPVPVTIRTTTMNRTVPTIVRSGEGVIPPSTAQADLATTDPLLDAMAFSRGRFVVEQAGQQPLVLPPYAEIGRVIEDCRR